MAAGVDARSVGSRAYVRLPLLDPAVKSDALTVSEYASRLGSALRNVGSAALEGEAQNVKTSSGGTLFFQLTDGQSSLSCKVFRREMGRLEHRPQNGDLVRVSVDRPDLYVVNGSLSLIASQVTLAGVGELLRRREELILRLTREGLCDPLRRRPLPSFPRAVGVIAGHGSDGMADVVTALVDRWPAIEVFTHSSLVQGKTAPRQLIDALATMQESGLVDVIVMARGGGSVQDLACFDDEALCRALFACEIPVVCAIGHTENNPVCNHVTWSAYTPSRSAEMVVPSLAEVRDRIRYSGDTLARVPATLTRDAELVQAAMARADAATLLEGRASGVRDISADVSRHLSAFFHTRITALADVRSTLAVVPRHAALELQSERSTLSSASGVLESTHDRILAVANQTADLGARIADGTQRQLAKHTNDYTRTITRLRDESLTGLKRRDSRHREMIAREAHVLAAGLDSSLASARQVVMHLAQLVGARDFRSRGWLLASKDGQPVQSANDLQVGDRLTLQLHDGTATSVVDDVESSDPQEN
jgi:exodeoxyribonuclease VII large subunit